MYRINNQKKVVITLLLITIPVYQHIKLNEEHTQTMSPIPRYPSCRSWAVPRNIHDEMPILRHLGYERVYLPLYKVACAALQSGMYTLSYPRGRLSVLCKIQNAALAKAGAVPSRRSLPCTSTVYSAGRMAIVSKSPSVT